MLRLVFPGSRREEGEGRVGYVLFRIFIEGEEGFIGVGGEERFWERYQAKILCPNFWGLEEAPATAMWGEDMNLRAAVCMVVVVVVWVVVVVLVVFEDAGISGRRIEWSYSDFLQVGRWFRFVCVCCRRDLGLPIAGLDWSGSEWFEDVMLDECDVGYDVSNGGIKSRRLPIQVPFQQRCR